jgi:hypothetical protein
MNHQADDVSRHANRDKVIAPLRKMAQEWMEVPLLARTHGQSATPTRVGRELMVFVERLENQLVHLENYSYFGTRPHRTRTTAHDAGMPRIYSHRSFSLHVFQPSSAVRPVD